MQNPSINSIQIKNACYRQLKLPHISIVKQIYSTGEFCDVQFVKIQQSSQQDKLFSQQLKSLKYALKRISKQKLHLKSGNYLQQYSNIYNQIMCLYMLSDHPNIIRIYWHYQSTQFIYILMQYGGLKLSSYIKKSQLSQVQIKQLFKQICCAVGQCHLNNIMHRDISLSNIVYNSQYNQCKLIDFGFTNQFTYGRMTVLGSLQYMAPQVYHEKKYNHKADIWSLGVVLYEIIFKRNPFIINDQEYNQEGFIKKRDKLEFKIDEGIMSKQAQKLIRKMLKIDPDKRPQIEEIINCNWLNNIDQDDFQSSQQQSQTDQFSHFIKRESIDFMKKNHHHSQLDNLNKNSINQHADNRKTKQLLMIPLNNNKQKMNIRQQQNYQQRDSDNFFFSKFIQKLNIDCLTQQLQNRLKQLISIHSRQIKKKKKLLEDIFMLQKIKIRNQLQKKIQMKSN